MPLAIYGGRRAIMEKIAPLGPVYQAGTLSGNPLSVAAALATLERLSPDVYLKVDALTEQLFEGFRAAVKSTGTRACVQRLGSMITLFFHPGPIESWDDAKHCDTAAFGKFHRELIRLGVYWPPAQFEAAFVSAAHDEADIRATIRAAEEALTRVSEDAAAL
jgi:glutamate-1-semialdehyde 2,1-aminomutase